MSTQSVDPRTGQAFGPLVPDDDASTVHAVCQEAAKASHEWGSLDAASRAQVLRTLADALDASSDRLVALADSETALGVGRLTGEVARTSFQLRMLSDAIEDGTYTQPMVDGAVAGAPPEGHPALHRVLMPIGPVAVYAASNFPFAFSVAGGDTASALAAGCPVVVKAHPGHPQTSEAVHGLLREGLAAAGQPAGVIGLVRGFEAGRALVKDPDIRAAAFTGSLHGGRALFDLANARPDPIPFYGELGSVNPVVVLPSAVSRPGLAGEYVDSLLLGGGQFCTNPSVLLVPAGAALVDEIVAELMARPPAVLLHSGVYDALDQSVARVMASDGIRVLAGEPGSTAGASERDQTRDPLLLGTTAAALANDRTPLEVECFGPVGLLVEYEDGAELLAVLAGLDGALVGCVHGEVDDGSAHGVVATLAARVGRVAWNAWPTGVAVSRAQHHGGPWPATTNPLHTSVGVTSIERFLRPVAFQSMPEELLPGRLGKEAATWPK